MSDETLDHEPGRMIEEPLSEALSRRYLAYALSTITSRALPDVRDGLKPVQRRILYAMRELKLNPDGAYKKCAKVVGEVMGNYHPHGDSAIYDTLVRLAQDFSVRYPLVDGQGNFGNIDGDAAAAMRYTESRLTPAAELLLEGLDEDAVDFRDTYDEQNSEPEVLPAGFPNLLANGATGIAVGMATSIPPHNAAELIDAAQLLIQDRQTPMAELMNLMPGPDFPTGGVVVNSRAEIREAYETGRGSFRLRARWHVEELGRGAWQIIVTEIPFHVQKSKLLEKLAELLEQKKIPLLADFNDESAEDVRLVLEPKSRSVDPAVLMESLFKLSDLETRFPLNMNVLVNGAPRVCSLRQVLLSFLDHRRDVVLRRARHRLDKIEKRLHLLDGYLIAYLNIDEVIRIIREEDEPKQELQTRFALTEIQAEAILNLRLRALRKLEEIEIRNEHDRLTEERANILLLLEKPYLQWAKVSEQLASARETFAPDTELGRRRSQFDDLPEIELEEALEALVPKEPITVVMSQKGWIRALRGHGLDPASGNFKDGDGFLMACEMQTTDKLILVASDGRAFTIPGDRLPGGRGHGEPIRLTIELGESESLIAMFPLVPEQKFVAASSAGYGFVVPGSELESQRKAGKQVLNPPSGACMTHCLAVSGDQLAVIGENRKLLVFPLSELPEMPRGKGVKLQNYRDGGMLDLITFTEAEGLTTKDSSGRTREWAEWREFVAKRASAGRMVPKGWPRSGCFHG